MSAFRILQKAIQGGRKLTDALTLAAPAYEAHVWGASNLESDLSALAEDWHEVGAVGEPAFENSWVNYDLGHVTAAFYKDPFGVVRVKGVVKTGTINTAIFTLPVGYRGAAIRILNTQSNAVSARLNINPDGTVVCIDGNNTWVSINCSFRAA